MVSFSPSDKFHKNLNYSLYRKSAEEVQNEERQKRKKIGAEWGQSELAGVKLIETWKVGKIILAIGIFLLIGVVIFIFLRKNQKKRKI